MAFAMLGEATRRATLAMRRFGAAHNGETCEETPIAQGRQPLYPKETER